MHRFLLIALLALCLKPSDAKPLADKSQTELEQRLDVIDTRLEQLAKLALRSGVGSIGYRYNYDHEHSDNNWIEIELEQEHPIDEVVLIPVIRHDMKMGIVADGFPRAFRILNENGAVLTEHTVSAEQLTRIAPLILPLHGQPASRIRIEVMQGSERAFDRKTVFQFAECMVFSGEENIALRKSVSIPERPADGGIGWDQSYLTDGTIPYLMNSGQGEQSIAYISRFDHNSPTPVQTVRPLQLTIDLAAAVPVSRIHLHAIEQGDTILQATPANVGTPKHLLVEGATHADFSDAQVLLDLRSNYIYEHPAIMIWNTPLTTCRYVRFTALDPYIYTKNGISGPRIGFAEIELYTNGTNAALGKTVSTVRGTHLISYGARKLTALTDGRNLYGTILPIRDWLHQLAERDALEQERPLITAELNERYASHQMNLYRMFWITGLLLAAAVIALLIQRNFRERAIFRTRERIAADLHDELGANLHAIGMLGGLVLQSQHSPERLKKLVSSMQSITERTGRAAHYCVNMLEDKERYADLTVNMRRTAERLTADLEHELSFEGETILSQLSARKRIDIFLFYKECLANIIRHSGATHITTSLKVDSKHLELTITDNGTGLNGKVPASLQRRARLCGGRVTSTPQVPQGSRLTLQLRIRGRMRLKNGS